MHTLNRGGGSRQTKLNNEIRDSVEFFPQTPWSGITTLSLASSVQTQFNVYSTIHEGRFFLKKKTYCLSLHYLVNSEQSRELLYRLCYILLPSSSSFSRFKTQSFELFNQQILDVDIRSTLKSQFSEQRWSDRAQSLNQDLGACLIYF